MTHRFNFDPNNSSGESLVLETHFLSNGDPDGIYCTQALTLNSYSNSVTLNLCGTALLTPTVLRRLAKELEKKERETKEAMSHLHGTALLTPTVLRRLAKELEKKERETKEAMSHLHPDTLRAMR
jgi:hypothetical protein